MTFMNKLLLTLIMLISVGSVHGMETQPSMTLPQLYYCFSHNLELLPEITQHIFFLQCGNSNLAELEQNCKSPELLVNYIETLIDACGDTLASEICECFFKHNKISICDIQDKYKTTCLHLSKSPNVTQILLKIADDTWKLLTIQTSSGFTALHFATCNKDIDNVKLLLDAAGNNVYELIAMQTIADQEDNYTALKMAVIVDQTEMVKLLLDTAGEKAQDLIMIKDNEKQTVLDDENNLPEINEILQSHMTNNKAT
jgi:ankyrin repeat protein